MCLTLSSFQVADHIVKNPFFMNHKAVFMAVGKDTGLLHTGFIHSTNRGPAAGGVKRFAYDSVGALVQDGLQQSVSSSLKAAHAGLWVGGGKILIPLLPSDMSCVFVNPTTLDGDALPMDACAVAAGGRKASNTKVFEEHAAFINGLQGCMISARDMGVTVEDMNIVAQHTPFCTWASCNAAAQGQLVGQGVAAAMEAALAWAGEGGLTDKRVAVMGAGHVAKGVIQAVLERGAKEVEVTDTNAQRIAELNQIYGGQRVLARVVPAWDMSILTADVDVLSPCAFSGAINPLTVPSVRARFIVGGANHTLLDPIRDSKALAQRGVTCVPDHISNRLALVSSNVRQAGILMNDPEIWKHLDPKYPLSIPTTVKNVLTLAKEEGCTPAEASVRLTQDALKQMHPIWPGRSEMIIKDLICDGWANNSN